FISPNPFQSAAPQGSNPYSISYTDPLKLVDDGVSALGKATGDWGKLFSYGYKTVRKAGDPADPAFVLNASKTVFKGTEMFLGGLGEELSEAAVAHVAGQGGEITGEAIDLASKGNKCLTAAKYAKTAGKVASFGIAAYEEGKQCSKEGAGVVKTG